MSYKKYLSLLPLLALISCSPSSSNATSSIDLDASSSANEEGKYNLKEKLETLKKANTFRLVLNYDLIDGTSNTGSTYIYTYANSFYAIEHNNEVTGISSGEDGIWTFGIKNNNFEAGPIYNVNIKSVYDKDNGIRNYFDGLNPNRVSSSDTFNFALTDSINLSAILNMASLTVSSGLMSLIQEAKVEANEDGLIFSLDFGVNGTIKETVTNIDDDNLTLQEYEDYITNGGKPRQAEAPLLSLMDNFSSYNYSSSMGSLTVKGKTIDVGTRYFSKQYIYEDYTDEYINYAKELGETVKRQGYIELNGNEYVSKGIYSFEIDTYDESNKPIFKDSSLKDFYGEDKLIKQYPYFNSLTFNTYLASFYSTTNNPYSSNESYYCSRSDLSTEFGNYIFGVKSAAKGMYIINEGTSQEPSISFIVDYGNDGYMVNVNNFNKTNILFIEDYIAK